MGNKDGDDIQVAEIDVLIFLRDNFSFVCGVFFSFFSLFFSIQVFLFFSS